MATWEIRITRKTVQTRGKRVRTVGEYQIFHNGVRAIGKAFYSGTTAESRGPGANAPASNGKRVEEGTYPLWTQAGSKYVTHGYIVSNSSLDTPKPGIELKETGKRTEILIHPGVGFLASIGCINLCTSLPDDSEMIDFKPSRDRVIDIIEDIKSVIGKAFPHKNGERIPGATCVIKGEPM